MHRRDRHMQLDAAEAEVQVIERLARNGNGIKASDYKLLQKTLRGLVPVTFEFKSAIIQELRAHGAVISFADGEADIRIRQRSAELLANQIPFVVMGNDCNYAIHLTIPTLLRPKGRSKFIEYDINILLSAAGFSHAQFQALGVVSHTDYSWNLPGLRIGKNSRIIKAISDGRFVLHVMPCLMLLWCLLVFIQFLDRHSFFWTLFYCLLGHDTVSTVLHRYAQNPEVQAAKAQYDQKEDIQLVKPVNTHAACRMYVDGNETPLTKAQTDGK